MNILNTVDIAVGIMTFCAQNVSLPP